MDDKTNYTREERVNFLELVLCEPLWFTKVELVLEYHELKKAMHPNWTIDKTAYKLGRSLQAVNKDLRIARAIRLNPKLMECKTKDDCEKSLGGGAQ